MFPITRALYLVVNNAFALPYFIVSWAKNNMIWNDAYMWAVVISSKSAIGISHTIDGGGIWTSGNPTFWDNLGTIRCSAVLTILMSSASALAPTERSNWGSITFLPMNRPVTHYWQFPISWTALFKQTDTSVLYEFYKPTCKVGWQMWTWPRFTNI